MFKPGDQVTLARDKATHDWVSPVFSDEPYEKLGQVMAVFGGKVYVWWDGSSVTHSPHDPDELRHHPVP